MIAVRRRRDRVVGLTAGALGVALWWGLCVAAAAEPLQVVQESPFGGLRPRAPVAGEPGGGGLAIRATKALVCGPDWGVVDDPVLLVRNGRIEAVGRQRDIEIPADYAIEDFGNAWLMPGMIDLHCHVAGLSLFQTNDLNDMVYMVNPGLRASASVVPGIDSLRQGLAGGITSVLYIPGSGTNIGGQGVLLKTWPQRFERMLIRNPGSLKLAQAGNPERWSIGVARSLMNWTIRNTFEHGLAAARLAREGVYPVPGVEKIDPGLEVFRDLLDQSIAVSAHTQIYQVVLTTITMVRRDLGVRVFIDHGTIGAWRTAPLAKKYDVPAIVGPRSVDPPTFARLTGAIEPGFRGVAVGYQSLGHTDVGFNTDSPIVPQEELPLQAALAARFGFKDTSLETVRGLTIIPARAAGIAERVGSLEVGKDADVLVISGHPADPRSAVRKIWIEGRVAYHGKPGGRLW